MPETMKKKQLESLNYMLREQVRKKHLAACMTDQAYDFFFVDVGDGPSWVAKKLSDDVAKLQSSTTCPKYETFLKVSKGVPISLPEVLKLNASIASYTANSNAQYAKELKQDGWDGGLPENSVVPSLYILNRKKSRSFGKNNKGEANLPTPVFDHYMNGSSEIDLGKFLSKKAGSEDGIEAAEEICSKCIDGTDQKEVRFTSAIAVGIIGFLKSQNPDATDKDINIETLFVWNPRRGEGNGRRTKVLSVSNGNVVPTVAGKLDYPEV